jgi:hypothetical protein
MQLLELLQDADLLIQPRARPKVVICHGLDVQRPLFGARVQQLPKKVSCRVFAARAERLQIAL